MAGFVLLEDVRPAARQRLRDFMSTAAMGFRVLAEGTSESLPVQTPKAVVTAEFQVQMDRAARILDDLEILLSVIPADEVATGSDSAGPAAPSEEPDAAMLALLDQVRAEESRLLELAAELSHIKFQIDAMQTL